MIPIINQKWRSFVSGNTMIGEGRRNPRQTVGTNHNTNTLKFSPPQPLECHDCH